MRARDKVKRGHKNTGHKTLTEVISTKLLVYIGLETS